MAGRDHVLLSYRSTERPFALERAAWLRNAGVQVWVDCLPDGIRPGDDWPRTFEEALNTCASAVVVLGELEGRGRAQARCSPAGTSLANIQVRRAVGWWRPVPRRQRQARIQRATSRRPRTTLAPGDSSIE
jgi:hypothetical protein